ncbi:MAG: OsmC family protein [Kosmotogaceae bacterium]|nr:OsmC family protein [Kosmotogaceae bacterium]
MGSRVHSKVDFKDGFSGTGITDSDYRIRIGKEGAAPYDLLLMSLASCLYATFLDILKKKKVEIVSTEIELSGEKREEIPTTLKLCQIKIRVCGVDASYRSSLEKSFELATKYCSVYKTISSVADIFWEIDFA